MAVTGTGPVLGALTNGANAVDAITWGSGYATDTGTLAPVSRQIRRGANPWRAVAATELVTTGQTVRVREVVFNTDYVGEAFTSDEITVGAAAVGAQTAYFGTSTLSGQGGYKPLDDGGVEMDVLSIVSGGATSPAAQVVDGRLCFAGTGAPDGATIRVETAEGEVDVTIATVAGKSIADPQHLGSALFTQRTAVAPIDLMLRPGAYDLNAGGALANGIFQSRNIPEAAHATVKRHPDQTSRPYFYMANPSGNSYWYSSSWITIDGCDFRSITNARQMVQSGSTTTAANRTRHITFKNVNFLGPEVSTTDLYDPTPWTGVGYTGILFPGVKLNNAYNMTFEDCTFRNIRTAGDFNPEGLTMRRVSGDNIYFDYIRIIPDTQIQANPTVPWFEDVTAQGFFAINNEISNTATDKSPHNDFFQVIGGELKWAVFLRCYVMRSDYRGDVITPMQVNSRLNRVTWHECILSPEGVTWGRNDEGSDYNLINQSTFVGRGIDNTVRLRFGVDVNGTPRPAIGEMRIVNTYIGTNGTSPVFTERSDTDDPVTFSYENSFLPESSTPSDYVQGPPNPNGLVEGKTALAPIASSVLDTDGIGALTVAGEFRGTEVPPLPGLAPVLTVDGADLTIAPQTSLYAASAPASWEWRHRTGDGAAWSSWTEETGADVTATGLATSGRQVMYRWKNSAGVAGVASDVSTVA